MEIDVPPIEGNTCRRTVKVTATYPLRTGSSAIRRNWLRPDLIAGMTTAAVVIPEGDGVCNDRGTSGPGGTVHRFSPHGDLRRPGNLSPAERKHYDYDRSFGREQNSAKSCQMEIRHPSSELQQCSHFWLVESLILASLLRLGFIANFISEPVLVGFKAGIGVVIVVDQIPKILGIHIPRASFFHNLLAIARSASGSESGDLSRRARHDRLVGRDERFLPQAPAPLIAVAAGIIGARILGLHDTRSGVSRRDSSRSALSHASRILPRAEALAWGIRHSSHEFYRDDCCWPSVRQE